jgi:hypothetical protein
MYPVTSVFQTQDHATPTNAVKPPTPGGTAVSGVVGGGRGAGGAVGGSGGARGWEVAPPPAVLCVCVCVCVYACVCIHARTQARLLGINAHVLAC